MPVEPVLALLSVAVLANLVITLAVVVTLVRRRPAPVARPAFANAGPVATGVGPIGRPEFDLFHGFPTGARDRVVRIVAWTFLIAATAIVTLSRLWPDTQPYILVVLALAGLFVVIVHDLLPSEALGPGKAIVEGFAGLTVAGLLVMLTGQVASPFVVTFALIVAGGSLVVSPRAAVVLVLAASLAYLAAVLVPIDTTTLTSADVARIGVTILALILLAYVAMVIAREQRRSREAAIRASTVDALTGLFNRAFLFAAVEREIARSGRSGRGFCLLMMDLDGLKSVNDRYGHHVGDRLLRSVGDVIRTGVRRIDTPARFGGDEFAILCPETDATGAFVLGEKIRLGVGDLAIEVPGGVIRPSVSVGVVAYPVNGETVDALFIAADQAMYRSKRAGKDRVSGGPEGGGPEGGDDLGGRPPVELQPWPPERP